MDVQETMPMELPDQVKAEMVEQEKEEQDFRHAPTLDLGYWDEEQSKDAAEPANAAVVRILEKYISWKVLSGNVFVQNYLGWLTYKSKKHILDKYSFYTLIFSGQIHFLIFWGWKRKF